MAGLGIEDEAFIRGKVPMTKAEIRCNAVAALQIPHDAVCWDIGCGTGSVSVEMAFRCPDGHVFAFDHNAEAVSLTVQNANSFSCDNISVITGNCPEILNGQPAPEVIFIGGSGGNLAEILAEISKKNPKAAVAMTAISLETLAEALSVFEQHYATYQITQIAVTRTKKIGSHTMPDPQNPVWLITGGLECSAS